MEKRNLTIFIYLSIFIVLLGSIFLFLDKDIFIPGFTNDTKQDIIVNGWPIVAIGVVMLLIGLLGKLSDNDQRKNKDIKHLPPTEFFDKHHQRYLDE